MKAPTKKPAPARPCPCRSGHADEACCAPFHRGEREPDEAVELMRSRYAAFAIGDAAYLWKTLHAVHEDRALPRASFERAIAAGRGRAYPSLAILDARRRGREAEVLFVAGLVERGRDASFVELSDFEHDGQGWRYRSGILVARADLGRDPDGLGIDEFLELAAARVS